MKTVKALASAALIFLFLAACGGGAGGDGSGGSASATAFPIWQAWVNSLTKAETKSFAINGTVGGVVVTGSGSATFGSLASSTFEGKSALAQTVVATGTISANGQSMPYGGTSTMYVDSNYQPLGSTSGSDYLVVSGTPTIPQTAKINDTGTLVTFTRYASGAKATVDGTQTVTFALLPDSASTAILRLVSTDKSISGTVTATGFMTYRITPVGTLTRISEEYQEGSTSLTLTYQ